MNVQLIQRTIEEKILQITEQFSVILITGPRQVGKTSILRSLSEKNRTYITLDDPILATQARSEPKLFLEQFPLPILIDEIQYAPQLFPYIKMTVDAIQKPGMFWLTGSQQFHLMKNVSESLAGRVAILNLLGLSNQEILSHPQHPPFLPQNINPISQTVNLYDLYHKIWRGFFPKIVVEQTIEPEIFYRSYVETYLQRDVRDLLQIRDLTKFVKFLQCIAARSSQILNMNDLARDVDLSPNTIKNWLSILEASGIIYFLLPYHNNQTKRLIKSPKIYFLDPGLCSYLSGWSTATTLLNGAMSGAILETYVVSEIIKSYWNNGRKAPIYYYRDKDQQEIDLLILENNTIYPLEIKKTANPSVKSITQFKKLSKFKLDIGIGALLCCFDKKIKLNHENYALPISWI